MIYTIGYCIENGLQPTKRIIMKKIFIAFMLMVTISISTYAVRVTTSCGTQYEVTGCSSVGELGEVAMWLDSRDC